MHIMFISLLFSITLSNVLHTMDREEQQDIVIDLDEDEDPGMNLKEACNIGLNRPEIKLITTLADMERLAKQISPIRTRSGGSTKIEVPDDIKFGLQVFDEYAEQEDLITESKPGWFRSMCCCRSQNNLFEHASPDFRKGLGKEILAIYFSPNDQTETITRNKFSNSGDESESDDGDKRSLEKKLKKAEWKNKKLSQKAVLDKKLRKFIERQIEIENNSDKWKERGFELLVTTAAILSVYFGICG